MTGPRVLVTRAAHQAAGLLEALSAVGLDPVLVPAIEIEFASDAADLDDALRRIETYRWAVVTSPNGAQAVLRGIERVLAPIEGTAWAAIGEATSAALREAGASVSFQPSSSTSAALAAELPISQGDRVLLVQGNLASAEAARSLVLRGAVVDDVVGYRTVEAPDASRRLLRAALQAGRPAAVLFTSGSTVRGLVELAAREGIDVRSIPSVCIGNPTAIEARSAGFLVAAISVDAETAGLAEATARAVRELSLPPSARGPQGATER